MTPDGRINENGGSFAGFDDGGGARGCCGSTEGAGFLEKVDPHVNRVGVSYRSKATIEPYLSKQWFVKMDGFGRRLRAAVETHAPVWCLLIGIPPTSTGSIICVTGASADSCGGVIGSRSGTTKTTWIGSSATMGKGYLPRSRRHRTSGFKMKTSSIPGSRRRYGPFRH